jgi:hypothetical protein
MASLTPHRDNAEIAIARFVAHVDSRFPYNPAEAIERRLTKIMVSELLRAYADFEDLQTAPEISGSHIENAITNGLMSLVMSIAGNDQDLGREGIEDILNSILERALSRVEDRGSKDVLVDRFPLPQTGRA